MLPSRSSFSYADETAAREASGSGRFSTAAELWCDEWMEWVERLENEVEKALQPNEEKQDGSECNVDEYDEDDDEDDDNEEEDDPDSAEFEIAWLMSRFETDWSAAKQQFKRTALIAKYGQYSNFVICSFWRK